MSYKVLIAISFCYISLTAVSQQLEKMILENWENGAWENRMRELPLYDNDGRLLKKEIAHWNASSEEWEDQTKTELARDENGILLFKETFKWIPELSAWQPSLKASYTVNDQNKPSYVLTEAYDENGWYNKSVDEYEYDASGNLVKKLLSRWDKAALAWTPYRKFDYRFEEDQMAGYSIYFWDNKMKEWQSYKRATYQYTEKEAIDHILYESWIDGVWKNHSIRRNIRDDEGALSVMEVEIFKQGLGIWQNLSHVDYVLTDFGKTSTSVFKKWQAEASNWENLQRFNYYYSEDGEMISEWTDSGKEMELFPNPAVERLTIRSLPKGTLTIVDALGKVVVQSENTENELQLDVSKWEIGIYSVRVDDKEVQQFVKQ